MASRTRGRGYDHLPEHRRRIYQQDRCTDFDDLLDQALAHGKTVTLTAWPDGTPIADDKDAWKLLGKIANTAKGKTVSVLRNTTLGLGPAVDSSGTVTARFQVRPKDHGRDFIAAKLEAGEPVSYNPAIPRARGKYICPQCHHRRSTAPRTLCLDCAADQATASAKQFAREQAEAARRTWGQAWDDAANWEVDHALAPPRTPREQADRPIAEQAREHLSLEQRIRQRTGQFLDWEEHAPARPAGRGITGKAAQVPRNLRAQAQAQRDRAQAAQLDGPHGEKIRQMLDEWTNGNRR